MIIAFSIAVWHFNSGKRLLERYRKHEAPIPNERDEGDVTLQIDL